jgi:predicted PurR-regulated permease PerM
MPKKLTKPFILILILLVLIGCYFVFRPFIMEILVAAILASIFYKPYEKLAKTLGNRRQLAALGMCLFLVIVIIVPTINILVYAAGKSVVAYSQTVDFFNQHNFNQVIETQIINSSIAKQFNIFGLNGQDQGFRTTILNVLQQSSNWLISGATYAVKETADFIISLVLIIFSMFFFFVDGKNILKRFSSLSPLPSKYDQEIFSKFREVSYTTFISTFVTAAAQGVIGAIGFAIIGFPVFLAGILVALLSLLPYLGSMIFYVPVGLYYLAVGRTWEGIFILLWGFLIIGTVDNIIRTYMIRGKVAVNPIFAFFSILGGIILFGFWGMVLGPLIIALAVTVFHIYEIEFSDSLERRPEEEKEAARQIIKEKKKELI